MIQNVFIQAAADILGETNQGLTTSEIVKYCSAYAFDFNVEIPYSSVPLPTDVNVPNKRTVLKKNLEVFSPKQQFKIIKELCELDRFKDNENVGKLKIELIKRYKDLSEDYENVDEMLIDETTHWLALYPTTLSLYKSACEKFKNRIFKRNILDDLRLSLEMLLKEVLGNEKSLENQSKYLGSFIQGKGGSKEFTNMFQKLVEYYSKYQNEHVKHNSLIIEEEIEFIFEITSSFMKHIVKINQKADSSI